MEINKRRGNKNEEIFRKYGGEAQGTKEEERKAERNEVDVSLRF